MYSCPLVQMIRSSKINGKKKMTVLPSTQLSSALVGRNIGESGKPQYRNSGLRGNIRGPNSGGVVCYYCCKLGHVIRDCKKLQNRN